MIKATGFIIFAKTFILDIWQGSEYASKLASKIKDAFLKSTSVKKATDNFLLEKSKMNRPNELQNSRARMLLSSQTLANIIEIFRFT